MARRCQCTRAHVRQGGKTMSDKSLLDLAYEYVENSKGSVTFKALWKAVCKAKGYDEPSG